MSTLHVQQATDAHAWDAFLAKQRFRPFLQSWTMGEVSKDTKQEIIRLEVRDGNDIHGIASAIIVPARRGRHLALPYGPVGNDNARRMLLSTLVETARSHDCAFIRMSPFLPLSDQKKWEEDITAATSIRPVQSPLHLLAEHVWYLPLKTEDRWHGGSGGSPRSEEELMAEMRKTTRNLVRRAERDGVEIVASKSPEQDVEHFIRLHDETRHRHRFVPYTNTFFRAQVARFAPRNECTLYLAKFNGEVIAASIHMHAFGETSYHHGASSSAHAKIPASYLLQWTAIRDAMKRGDDVYNFWGIAPMSGSGKEEGLRPEPGHPFAGVTLFKTGFGGTLLDLTHATDVPLKRSYTMTRIFETVRKWKRGF